MQGKNLIVTALTAILIAICGYQLLFTWKTQSIENKALAYAENIVKAKDAKALFPNDAFAQLVYEDSINNVVRRFKNNYLDSIATEKVFLGQTYNSVKSKQLNLGLDLKGGMSVVLQVSLRELLVAMSDKSKDAGFLKSLDIADSEIQSSNTDYLTLFLKAFKANNPDKKLATIFATRANEEKVKFNSTDNEVEDYLRSESKSAIERTYNIISSRVDKFGVTSPTVNLEPKRGRITVELAGVDNPTRVRKLLQASASLEFWETYTAAELGGSLNEANTALKNYLDYEKNLSGDTTKSAASLLLDDEITDSTSSKDPLSNINKKDSNAVKAAKLEKAKAENPLFMILNPAIDNQNKYQESPLIGYSRAKDTAQVNSYLNVPEVRATFPADVDFMWSNKSVSEGTQVFGLYSIRKPLGGDDAEITGDMITRANADVNQKGQNSISMAMNNIGSRKWSELTGKNIGKFIAIVVDKEVYSAPVVNGQIDGGNSEISGTFTVEEANDLANILKIGKLPTTAKIVEEETVGATLGKESIKAGLLSLLFSFIIIMLFMVVFYSSGGMVANIVLFLNVFLLLGILSYFGYTLTLPGIAGIVLTLGMAVDANVIIYERVKEELRLGLDIKKAMQEGYKHSLSAILDGNITTFLTAAILFFVGLGPVKGFAITLMIGIITTLFTAVLVSQVLIHWLSEKGKTISAHTSFTENFLQNINFDFIGVRKITYIISTIVIIAGFVSFATRGFELGVDFKGGRQYKVRFAQQVNNEEVKTKLDAEYGEGTIVKTVGTSNQIKITTSYKINENNKEIDEKVEAKLYNGLKSYLEKGTTYETFKKNNIMSSMKIEPSISSDMKTSAMWATILSLLVIFVYVLVRFRTVGYSVGAIAATAHDAFFVIALFSIFHGKLPFSMEVDQTFIAAILTIVGYSVNDTVIIFDRLREYLGLNPKADMKQTMNDAINSTLSRTFNTAFTVFITVLILFIFGGSVLKGFSFAMLVGVIVGCYSSVFIASPIMYDINNRLKKNPEPVKL